MKRRGDRRQRRLVFKEAAASFEAFDFGSNIRELALHVKRVCDLSRLFHYLEKLAFQSFLVSQSRFNVEVFFRDILSADLLLNDSLARVSNLIQRRRKLRGRYSSNHGDALAWFCARGYRILFELRRDHESTVRFGGSGDLSQPFGWRFGLESQLAVANDLPVNSFRGCIHCAYGSQ